MRLQRECKRRKGAHWAPFRGFWQPELPFGVGRRPAICPSAWICPNACRLQAPRQIRPQNKQFGSRRRSSIPKGVQMPGSWRGRAEMLARAPNAGSQPASRSHLSLNQQLRTRLSAQMLGSISKHSGRPRRSSTPKGVQLGSRGSSDAAAAPGREQRVRRQARPRDRRRVERTRNQRRLAFARIPVSAACNAALADLAAQRALECVSRLLCTAHLGSGFFTRLVALASDLRGARGKPGRLTLWRRRSGAS